MFLDIVVLLAYSFLTVFFVFSLAHEWAVMLLQLLLFSASCESAESSWFDPWGWSVSTGSLGLNFFFLNFSR